MSRPRLLPLALLAARETLRQPLCPLLSTVLALAVLLLPLVLNYTLGDTLRIVRDSALSLTLLGTLVLAAHSAVQAVSRDLRRGPAAVLLATATRRAPWFLAKCFGVALAMLPCAAAALLATLLAVRVTGDGLRADLPLAAAALSAPPLALAAAAAWNYATRRPAHGLAAVLLPLALGLAYLFALARPHPDLPPPALLDAPLAVVALLLFFPVLMAIPLAAAAAVRLPPAPALTLALLVFGAGLVSSPLLAPRLSRSAAARVLHAALPDLQAYWRPDALDDPAHPALPPSYLARAALAAAAWASAAALLGLAALHRKEIPA